MIELINGDCMEAMSKMKDKELIAKKKKAERNRLWYQRNKARCAEKAREYRHKDIKAYNQYRTNYRKGHPSGIFDCIKGGAKKRGIEFNITRQEFIEWHELQDKKMHLLFKN